jgi:hypothetical protein
MHMRISFVYFVSNLFLHWILIKLCCICCRPKWIHPTNPCRKVRHEQFIDLHWFYLRIGNKAFYLEQLIDLHHSGKLMWQERRGDYPSLLGHSGSLVLIRISRSETIRRFSQFRQTVFYIIDKFVCLKELHKQKHLLYWIQLDLMFFGTRSEIIR